MGTKFEKAYVNGRNTLISVEEIAYEFDHNRIRFENEIRGNLYCPQCKQARLSFRNARNPYLATYPHGKHTDDCDLGQEELSTDLVAEYVQNSTNHDSIKRQQQSIMKYLLQEENTIEKVSKDSANPERTDYTATKKNKKTERVKPIPRKRIDLPLNGDDFETYKMFYGEVLLKFEKCRNSEKQKLLIWSSDDNIHFLCKIFVSRSVFEHLPAEHKRIICRKKCKMVLLASLHKNQDETKLDEKEKEILYPLGNLEHSDFLTIIPS